MIPRWHSNSDRLHLVAMLALTFSTGIVDAVGFLGLDRVFAGNMTGNVAVLGMALTGADELPVVGPAIALAAFVTGATLAGRGLRNWPPGSSPRTTSLLSAVAGILLVTTVASLATEDLRSRSIAYVITAALSLAMGIQGGTARHIGVKDVPTTVVTSALVGLAFESRLGGNFNSQWKPRAAAILLLVAGAATGALLLRFHFGFGTALSAAITTLVAIGSYKDAPR
jgi:uncharacterized membrane protein YoaK (UPF0700 family)